MIEVNEYVRTNKIIARVIGKDDDNNILLDTQQILIKTEEKIVKHSKQLIDLIEVGDYVNGKYVQEIKGYGNGKYILALIGIIEEQDIKTILTKEQYMANCYKVGGEDE